MKAFAAAGAFLSATIGSSISMVGFGTTSVNDFPADCAAYASLSYVMTASPVPDRNVLNAFEPDESWETTCLKSFVTNWSALWSPIPCFRIAPYAASTFHFAEPELNGLGVTTWTPGLTRSSQLWMCFGFPGRTTNA